MKNKTMRQIKKSKKIEHLQTAKHRSIILIGYGGEYYQVINCGKACYKLVEKERDKYVKIQTVYSIGVVLDFINQYQPDLRKWRMS